MNELDEIRQDAIQQTILVQNQRSKWHDKFIKKKQFQPSDWDVLFDSRFKTFKGKITTRWLSPYEVVTIYDNGVVKIKTIDDGQVSFIVNGPALNFTTDPFPKRIFYRSCQPTRHWPWLMGKFLLPPPILEMFFEF